MLVKLTSLLKVNQTVPFNRYSSSYNLEYINISVEMQCIPALLKTCLEFVHSAHPGLFC